MSAPDIIKSGVAEAVVVKNLWGVHVWSQAGCREDDAPFSQLIPEFNEGDLQFFYESNGDSIALYSDRDLLAVCRLHVS